MVNAFEPAYFLPKLPLQLLNGGIGVGHNAYHYPCYHEADLIAFLLYYLRNPGQQPPQYLTPKWRGYRGAVTPGSNTFFALLPDCFEITGLGIQSFSSKLIALGLDNQLLEFKSTEAMACAWMDLKIEQNERA